MTQGTTEVHIRKDGRAGHITLARPKVLNALNHSMVKAIDPALRAWAEDDEVALVLVDAEGEKAFCAGGDIAEVCEKGKAGDYEFGRKFWRDEYIVNLMISRYAKPYVAFMDGIVMGGGVGLSAHGSHRIVTERTMLAMPECGIGLITDVGGTHVLAGAPGAVGEYLGLTGTRLGADDAIFAGFADVYVPSERLDALKARLIETGDVTVIGEFSETPPEGTLRSLQAEIDAVFSAPALDEIIERLRDRSDEWAQKALAAIERGSPISLETTLAAIRKARDENDMASALRTEYRFVSRCMEHSDFIEGVRALIIDKDKSPKWRFPTLADLPEGYAAFMLSEAEGGDLKLK